MTVRWEDGEIGGWLEEEKNDGERMINNKNKN